MAPLSFRHASPCLPKLMSYLGGAVADRSGCRETSSADQCCRCVTQRYLFPHLPPFCQRCAIRVAPTTTFCRMPNALPLEARRIQRGRARQQRAIRTVRAPASTTSRNVVSRPATRCRSRSARASAGRSARERALRARSPIRTAHVSLVFRRNRAFEGTLATDHRFSWGCLRLNPFRRVCFPTQLT